MLALELYTLDKKARNHDKLAQPFAKPRRVALAQLSRTVTLHLIAKEIS